MNPYEWAQHLGRCTYIIIRVYIRTCACAYAHVWLAGQVAYYTSEGDLTHSSVAVDRDAEWQLVGAPRRQGLCLASGVLLMFRANWIELYGFKLFMKRSLLGCVTLGTSALNRA